MRASVVSLGARRLGLLSVVGLCLWLHVSASALAQAIAPQRPGTSGTGNLMLPLYAVYNSQYPDFKGAGSVRPWSPFGRGFTPIGGYIYQRGQTLVVVGNDGEETPFVQTGKTYSSVLKSNGDVTQIIPLSVGYNVVYPDSRIATFGHVHDKRAYFTSAKDPDGRIVSSMTWSTGIPQTFTDQRGWVTTFMANGKRLVSQIRLPQGLSYQFTYSPKDELTLVTAGRTPIASLRYDDQGNLVEFRDRQGRSYFYAYSADNRLSGMGDGLVNSSITYRGDVVTTDRIEGSRGSFERTTYKTYNGSPMVMKQEWGPTRMSGNTITLLSLQRDSNGNLSSVTDHLNRTTRFSFDPNGLATAISHPDGRKVNFGYDQSNRVASQAALLPSGGMLGTVKYSYDSKGRQTSEATQDSNAKVVGSWQVQRDGNKITMTRNRSTVFKYNPSGPKGEIVGVKGPMFESSTTLDKYGLPTSVTSNGVKTDIIPVMNQDGSSKVTLSSGGLSKVVEIDASGTKRTETFGDANGRFVQTLATHYNTSTLSPSYSVTSQIVAGDLNFGEHVSSESTTTATGVSTTFSRGLQP